MSSNPTRHSSPPTRLSGFAVTSSQWQPYHRSHIGVGARAHDHEQNTLYIASFNLVRFKTTQCYAALCCEQCEMEWVTTKECVFNLSVGKVSARRIN